MDYVLKLKTTEGWEWLGLYACWLASLAVLEHTLAVCSLVFHGSAQRFYEVLVCGSMRIHA
jgi:hypothetical protein